MKKKLIYLISIIVCLVPSFFVDAELACVEYNGNDSRVYKRAFSRNQELCSVENSLIYDVSSFSIGENGENVSFEGWAFLDHMDNYGGKNLKTWIIAYVGTWNESWGASIRSGTLSSNNNYYAVLTTPKTKDLYWSRANGGSSSTQLSRVNNTSNHTMQTSPVDGRNGIYTIDWCIQLAGNVNGKTKWHNTFLSRCLYYNVGFSVNISVDDIVSVVGNDKNVKFRIMSAATYQQNDKCSTETSKTVTGVTYECKKGSVWTEFVKYDSVDIGIHPSSCKTIFGESCSDIKDGDVKEKVSEDSLGENRTVLVTRSFTFGGLSDSLTIGSINVKPCSKQNCSATYSGSKSKTYLWPISYDGISYTIKGATSNEISVKSKGSDYSSRVYKIGVGNLKENSNKTVNPYANYYFRNGNKDVYVPAPWVRVSGIFELKLSSTINSVECSDELYCIGGNCQNHVVNSDNVCDIFQKPKQIKSGLCSTETPKNSCDAEVSFSTDFSECVKTYTTTQYYYRVSVADMAESFEGLDTSTLCTGSGYNVKYSASDGGYYYFPITFKANAAYSQNSTFKVVKANSYGNADSGIEIVGDTFVNDQTISKAGRRFNYAFNYDVSASWNYYKNTTSGIAQWSWETTENNTYGRFTSIKVKDSANSCSKDINVNVSLYDGDSLWYLENNTWTETTYNVDLYQKFVKKNVNSVYQVDALNATVAFQSSNDASDVSFSNTTAGVFQCDYSPSTNISSWEPGTNRSANCTYRLKPAYIQRNTADVVYENKDGDEDYMLSQDYASSLYYVPLKLKNGYNAFSFKINSENLSLIDGIDYKYDTTCKLGKIINELVTNTDYGVRYRTISVENPFPTIGGNIDKLPQNWKEYVLNHGGLNGGGLNRILNQSFSAISYKTAHLNNQDKSLFEQYGNYIDVDDMDNDGNSSVIANDEIFGGIGIRNSISGRNHCASGIFNENCDKVLE